MDYDELSLLIEPSAAGEGAYKVRVTGPTGTAEGVFEPPFDERDLKIFVLEVGRTRRGVRKLESSEMRSAREFGTRLFDAVFQAEIRDVYRQSFATARGQHKGLRLKLSLTAVPELMDVPWEYLYEDPDFLSISGDTPIVRSLDLPWAQPPLEVQPPLQILGMVSAPIDAVELDVQAEQAKLEQALNEQGLIERGLVRVRWLEDATLLKLQQALERGTYHVFHYIGHGAYDEEHGEGVLLLEDEQERGRQVAGSRLATVLKQHPSLRLAVLNACEGARSSPHDVFGGVATSLVRREIPAVIAMQFEITDRAAIRFAEAFYFSLAGGKPVDFALAKARLAIFADDNDVEWGTPVLFMRVPDGQLFSLPPLAPKDEEKQLLEPAKPASPAEEGTARPPKEPATVASKPTPQRPKKPRTRPASKPSAPKPAVHPAAWGEGAVRPLSRLAHTWGVKRVALSPRGRFAATFGDNKTVVIWDPAKEKELRSVKHGGWFTFIKAIAFSPDGTHLVTAADDKTARVWDVGSGKEIARLEHGGHVLAVAFSPDGRCVATGSADKTARVWSAADGRALAELGHGGGVRVVVFSPDGSRLATGSDDGTARTWEAASSKEIARVDHANVIGKVKVRCIAFSSDGKRLISGGEGRTALIWDAATGEQFAQLKHDALLAYVVGVAFSPDDELVATATSATYAHIWSAKRRKQLASLTHGGAVNAVCFSPDGNYLATASADKTARLWDRRGKELAVLTHEGAVTDVVVSSDGRRLFTASEDKTARMWELAQA